MQWVAETPVYLYGAAGFGTYVHDKISLICNIVSFIDKRHDEIKSYLDLPVVSKDFPSQVDKKSSVVIVCVKNIFEHEPIVIELLKNGYENILYYPIDGSQFSYRDSKERNNLIKMYNDIKSGIIDFPCEIPLAKGLFTCEFTDNAILENGDKSVTALVPSFFVYSRPSSRDYLSDIPVLSLFAHLDAYDYFSGNANSDIKIYTDIMTLVAGESGSFETTPRWKENILDARRAVFEKMDISAQISPDFFVEHAVEAVWNKDGKYFNMFSGKHRAMYLVHKKQLFIPLNLSKEDYNSYLNMGAVDTLSKYILKNQISEMPFTILHPYFVKMAFSPRRNFFNLLYDFVRWLSKELYLRTGVISMRGISAYDATGLMHPFMQCLYKLGCDVSGETIISEFEELINRLYHIPSDAYNAKLYSNIDILFLIYNGNQMKLSIPAKAHYYVILLDNVEMLPCASELLSISLKPLGRYYAGKEYFLAVGIDGK